MDLNKKFLTVEEIAEMLQVDPRALYRLIKQGRLIAYKIGGNYRVDPEDLQKFLENERTVK